MGSGEEGKWWRREVVMKGSGEEGRRGRWEMVTMGSGEEGKWWRREVVMKGSGEERKWWRRKWWGRKVVTKGSGEKGKWWGREVVTMGSGDIVLKAVCVVLCVSWSYGCKSHCNGCMDVAWALFWGGSQSAKPCVFPCISGCSRRWKVPPVYGGCGCGRFSSSSVFCNKWLFLCA